MNINFIAACGCFALAASPVAAQPLSTFLEAAERENLDVRSAEQTRTRADADFGQAWGSLLPTLTASGGWTHNQYAAIVEFPTSATTTQSGTIVPKDQLDAQLKAEVPLIDVSRWLKTAAASSNVEGARERERATHEQVARQVVNAYYAWVATGALQVSASKSLAVANAQVETTASRQAAGVAGELELSRARAEAFRNAQVLADAEALVATTARTLRTLTGVEPATAPALPDDDLHAEAPLAELEPRVGQLPRVRAAQLELETAGRTQTAATVALVPTVNAQVTQRFTNATGFQGQGALYNAGLTFNWRLDVPTGFALKAQAAQQASAAIEAERARRAAADQLHADWQQTRAAITKVRAAAAQVTAAARASSLAHERYAAGEMCIRDRGNAVGLHSERT